MTPDILYIIILYCMELYQLPNGGIAEEVLSKDPSPEGEE